MTNQTFTGEAGSAANFQQEVAQDARLQARYDLACEYVTAVATELGFTVSRDTIATLPSVRLAVLASEPFGAEFEREIRSLPAYAEAKKAHELAAKVKDSDDEALEQMKRMNPAARMSFARANGLDRPADTEQESAALRATRLEIAQGLSPAKRLAYCRAHRLC